MKVLGLKITGALALTACALCIAGAVAPAASAKSCPNASTTTVRGTPSYTYTRGCIVSFDGTPIVYNLFEPSYASRSHPVYAVLVGPYFGQPGDTSPGQTLLPMLPNLVSAGYAELTWDPRGFGQSGGLVEFDSPQSDGMDVVTLIRKVLAGRPDIVKDRPGSVVDGVRQPRYLNDSSSSNSIGQPAVGMAGYSYGAGIQFAAASDTPAVKTIVPQGSWNDLDYSLFPGNVLKTNWDLLLYAAAAPGFGADTEVPGDVSNLPTLGGTGGVQIGGFDPMAHYAVASSLALGYPDQATRAFFYRDSMASYGVAHPIGVPALLIQGTVDTLFNLNDAWASDREIKREDRSVPVKMIAYCEGHDRCPPSTPVGAGYLGQAAADALARQETIAWLDHYLRGQEASDGMPSTVVYQDQTGAFHDAATFPTCTAGSCAKDRSFTAAAIPRALLLSTGLPSETTTSIDPSDPEEGDETVVDGVSPPGPTTESVPIGQLPRPYLLGEPHLSLNVTVNGRGANLFFKLIDTTTDQVIDQQTSAIRLDNLDLADNAAHVNIPITRQNVDLDLGGVAYDLAHDSLALQITTSSFAYSNFRGAAEVTINGGKLYVPTATGSVSRLDRSHRRHRRGSPRRERGHAKRRHPPFTR